MTLGPKVGQLALDLRVSTPMTDLGRGRKFGQTSEAIAAAARRVGKMGGRPRKGYDEAALWAHANGVSWTDCARQRGLLRTGIVAAAGRLGIAAGKTKNQGRRRKYEFPVGFRAGCLVVLDDNGSQYKVLCDCGIELWVYPRRVEDGRHRFAPGYRRCSARCTMPRVTSVRIRSGPRRKAAPKSLSSARLFRSLIRGARDRDLDLSITLSQFESLRAVGECHYCGGALPPKSYGLDRIDNARGYDIDNVVPCCTMCNWARGGCLSYDEFRAAMDVRIARTGRGHAWPKAEEREAKRQQTRLRNYAESLTRAPAIEAA